MSVNTEQYMHSNYVSIALNDPAWISVQLNLWLQLELSYGWSFIWCSCMFKA